ncbi:chemotaxis protein CheA [Dissulfurispira sp.]|uniref:chemotaxis protein CheA n=1 Tax=Dissulfurispira sp. TaxID=2817609 RepID=UPI002FDA3FC9
MVDFKKLYGVFVDEAMERLVELENGLLQLERSPDDKELLNTIFRAAHTIKGSSGSIGLKDISRFTHVMEEILDMVRQDSLSAGKDLINVLLEAADVIKEMVGCVASETAFDFSRCTDLIRRMEEIKKSSESVVRGQEIKTFKIIFVPSPDLLKRGIDPLIIINDLKKLGAIANIKAIADAVPALSDMNPENLYLRWDIQLRTNGDESEIKNVFEFVEDGSDIRILPVTSHEYEKYMTPIGKMLVDEGIVKAEDVEDALKTQKKLGEILIEQGKVTPKEIERVLEKQSQKKIESFKGAVSSTIRVDLKKLDHLINIVGEMVIIHSMFQQVIQGNWQGNGGNATAERLDVLFSQLQRIGSDIQESAMSLRMLPVGEVFQRFTRLVRELSASKNKNIELIITGEDTELDKGVLEKIADPLVHLIRNSIDHGIETPEERLSKGKPAKGTIHLRAYQMGDSVYIDVEDDGRGLNKEKIIEKAVSKGIISSGSGLADDHIYNLIFMPGFSTAESVTDVSGRGVGMDVVKKNIESLNGKVYIRTRQDTGTTMSIKLPLTLAIIDGLTLLVGEEVFAIPVTSVVESLRPNRMDVKSLNEKGEVINVRGEYIPLIRLYEILGITSWKKDPWDAIVIVTMHEGRKYGLLVDELMGEQQIVIKNLGSATPRVSGIGGGTILGDGRVALVLDVPGIVEMVKKM